MPKSTKHKKARVADFAKAKLKLGKGKQIANNATNTSISSRSLALPTQLASVAPTTAPTSRRNLPLSVLLSQTTHHAPNLRLLALTEARQLIQDHPHLIKANAPNLLRALGGLMGDPSGKVRRMARETLEEVLKSLGGLGFDDDEEDEDAQMTVEQGSPLEEIGLPTIVYTLSALSSLEEDVRIDALESLSMLIRVMPGIVVGGWTEGKGEGFKVLEALLGVMRIRALIPGAGTTGSQFTSSANADLSPSARLATLKTLSLFLHSSLSLATDSSEEPWYLLPSFSSPRAYNTFLASLSLNSSSHQPLSDLTNSGYLVEPFSLATLPPQPFPGIIQGPTSNDSSRPLNSFQLLKTIHPTLLSTFLDSAPSAFSPNPAPSSSQNTPLETVMKVMEISKEVFWDLLGGVKEDSEIGEGVDKERDEARGLLLTLLGHMVKYFPFGADGLVARSAEVDQIHQSLSLLYSSLVALLVLSEPESRVKRTAIGSGKKGAKRQEKEEKKKERTAMMVDGVGEWVGKALRGELTTATSPMAVPFPASSFLLLEPTLWALLNSTDVAVSNSILEAAVENFRNATGDRKKVAFGWLSRVVLITNQPTYVNRFSLDQEESGPDSVVGKWVLSLPRYLWELGKKDEEGSEMVLTFLLKLGQQGHASSLSIFPALIFASLAPSLIPFFHLQHPSRGSMPGPFVKLAVDLQTLAVDFASYLLKTVSTAEGKGMKEAVGRAVKESSVPTAIVDRWARCNE